jgi:hypothetical protein
LKIVKLIIVFVLLQFSSSAQEVLLNIPDSGKTITSFVPKGYLLMDSVSGDLNKDGKLDYALALKHKEEDTFQMDEVPKRILLILFKSKFGFKLVGNSDEVLMCRDCGGVVISNGVLFVMHYGGSNWRWSEQIKLRFQKDALYLIGSTSYSYWVMNDCGGSVGEAGKKYKDINYVTGEEEVIEKDEECKLIKQTKRKQPKKSLIKLEDFKYDFKKKV